MSDLELAYHLVALAEAAPLANWQPRPNVIVRYLMVIRDGVRVVVRVDSEYRQWQVTISEATGREPRDTGKPIYCAHGRRDALRLAYCIPGSWIAQVQAWETFYA